MKRDFRDIDNDVPDWVIDKVGENPEEWCSGLNVDYDDIVDSFDEGYDY